MFCSSMLMSALAFGADGVVSVENGYSDYVPSEFSHQGLAQVIDDYFPHIEGVEILSTKRSYGFFEKAPSYSFRVNLRPPTRFSFRVDFSAQNEEAPYGNGRNLRHSCMLDITYQNIESAGYYAAIEGRLSKCKVHVQHRVVGFGYSTMLKHSPEEVIVLDPATLSSL